MVVGSSGSGKTSFIEFFLKLYDFDAAIQQFTQSDNNENVDSKEDQTSTRTQNAIKERTRMFKKYTSSSTNRSLDESMGSSMRFSQSNNI